MIVSGMRGSQPSATHASRGEAPSSRWVVVAVDEAADRLVDVGEGQARCRGSVSGREVAGEGGQQSEIFPLLAVG